jgi:peroxiredoxin
VGTRAGIALIVVLVAFAATLILLAQPETGAYVETGVEAPAFTLAKVGGDRPASLADFRGKAVLLNFWATWCKPCEEELPSMERLYRSLAGEPFELLAISVDEEAAPVEEFRARYGLTFPILLDASQEVARAYQTFRFPETFLIDGEGRVVQRYIGPRTWDADEYAARIRSLASVLR